WRTSTSSQTRATVSSSSATRASLPNSGHQRRAGRGGGVFLRERERVFVMVAQYSPPGVLQAVRTHLPGQRHLATDPVITIMFPFSMTSRQTFMSKRYHLYAIGNALVDTELEVSDDFLARMEIGKGMMTLVDEARQAALVEALNSGGVLHRRASGGSACNTVVAARYFGANTYYACKVADDETGNFFVDDLRAAGVDTNMMNGGRPQGVSGKCLVMVTPDAERTMNTFLGISETVSVTELDEDAIRASEFVYIEGYLVTSDSGRAAAIRLRELAEQHGVRTALTFSDPAMTKFFRDGLEQMLGNGVDLLFCN